MITQKELDRLAELRAARKAPAAAAQPALGAELGTSGKRFLPAGTTIGAFAGKVGKTVAQLEVLNGRSLDSEKGPAWLKVG